MLSLESFGNIVEELSLCALWLIVICVAAGTIFSRHLLKSLAYLAIFSLVSACLYLSMQAPDVAITEAAIGAAISTIFFLAAIRSVGEKEETPRKHIFVALLIVGGFTLTMLSTIVDMPAYGDKNSPANTGSSKSYVEESYQQTAIPNVVTSVLASYRGFDTLGETLVILAAAFSVLLILPSRKEESDAV